MTIVLHGNYLERYVSLFFGTLYSQNYGFFLKGTKHSRNIHRWSINRIKTEHVVHDTSSCVVGGVT